MNNTNYEQEILKEMEQQEKSSAPLTFVQRAIGFYLSHKWHSIFVAVMILVTAIACVPMNNLGDKTGINSLAKKQLWEDIEAKTNEYKQLEKEKEQLNTTIYNLTQAASENGSINAQMKEHEEDIEGLNTAIEQARAISESLDKQLEQKKKADSQMTSITSITPGASRTLKAGDYRCPGAIKAGTYKISGSEGNIVLYDISNSIRVSKKLETLDGNEFTLTIAEGEKLKVDKTVKITSMN